MRTKHIKRSVIAFFFWGGGGSLQTFNNSGNDLAHNQDGPVFE